MKALLIAAVLALPVVASANDQQKTEKNKVKDTTTAVTSDSFSESKAINKIHHVNTMNVELGTLGQTRGGSDKIRKFGERLVKDHQKLDTQVSQYAKDKGINIDELAVTAPIGGKADESASGSAVPGDVNSEGNPGGSSATNRSGSQMGSTTPNSYGEPSGSGSAHEKSGTDSTGSTASNSYGTGAAGNQGTVGSTGSQGGTGSTYDQGGNTANPPDNLGSTGSTGSTGSMGSSGMASGDDQQQMKQRKEAKLDALRNLQGAEFDSQFLSDVVDGSQKAIDRLQGWKGQAGDKKLDDLIDKSVKLLQTDVKDAQKLQQRTPAA